jgi:hypothetical protein
MRAKCCVDEAFGDSDRARKRWLQWLRWWGVGCVPCRLLRLPDAIQGTRIGTGSRRGLFGVVESEGICWSARMIKIVACIVLRKSKLQPQWEGLLGESRGDRLEKLERERERERVSKLSEPGHHIYFTYLSIRRRVWQRPAQIARLEKFQLKCLGSTLPLFAIPCPQTRKITPAATPDRGSKPQQLNVS